MSQLWQQQLLYKQLQLQELQRRQQQQQQQSQQQQQQQHGQMTEMPSWQNSNPSQMQPFQGQMTEMPSWPNMIPNPNPNPQMFFPNPSGNSNNNMNWAQYGINPGLMNNYQNGILMQPNTHNQIQNMRNMGMIPQQIDPSIFQNPQFLAMAAANNNNTTTTNNNSTTTNNNENMMNNFIPDTAPRNNNNNPMQNFLGESSFNNTPAQTGGSSLDPEEEKLLYGDDNWIGSFGKSVGGGFVNSADEGGNNNNGNNNNLGGAFNAGSWSALMQDALEASSSETGQNEEWSGLNVSSKNEQASNVPSFMQNVNNKNEQANNVPSFLQNVSNKNEQANNVPSFMQNNSNQFAQNQEQERQLGNNNGIWGQDGNNNNNNNNNNDSSSNNNSLQFMQRGQQGVWVPQNRQQASHNFTNQNNNNNKPNGWNSNNVLAQNADNNNNNNNSSNSNNGSNMYAMQPPKNFNMMNPNQPKVNQERTNKQESPILFPNPNPNPNAMGGGGYSPAQLGMQMGQNVGNLGMNFGPNNNNPFGNFPLLQSQLNQQMAKNQVQEQRFNENQHNTTNNVPSDKREEEHNNSRGVQSKDTLFNGSIPLFSQNRMAQQPSQNMLELFQKTEKQQPPKSPPPIPETNPSAFDTSSPNHPHNNNPQHMQNFGLMLGPPSQRQTPKPSLDPDHHAPIPSTSSNNSQGENVDNNSQNRPKEANNTSNMFQNVWTNVPRNKIITPSIIQSMMHATSTEAGTSSASSAQEERQLLDKNSVNAPVGSKRGLNSEENILQGRPLNAPQSNYSLLNQVQNMRGTDLDAGNRLNKRLRPETNNNNDNNSNSNKMNYVSRESEEKMSPAGAPSEVPKVINPQMAPSWFEQYGNYRNGQNISNISSVNETNTQRTINQQFSFPKVPWNMDNNKNNNNNNNNNNNSSNNISGGVSKIVSEQGVERSTVTPISRFGPQSTGPASNINNNNNNNNVNINNNINVNNNNEVVASPPVQSSAIMTPPVVKEKSRKTGTRKMVPFHKVIEVPETIRSTSVAEMDWAQTANRLFDKVDDEMDLVEEGQLTFALSRRRLIFTTKLTQHLLPAVPPRFLRAKADSSYESIVYFASNFALRDACSLICSNKNNSSDENNSLAEKSTNMEKGGEQFFAKVVDASTGRFKKLEEDFIRLNKRTSVLDMQLECQELERFSIVNRLGKFHGRSHILSDPKSDASAQSGPSRTFFQRAVTASPMPQNISESSLNCLSL